MDKIEFFKEMMEELGYKEAKVDQILYPKPEWAVKQIIRESGLIEDVCVHGIGHPNRNWLNIHDPDGSKGFACHGCDLCCCDDETKKRIRNEKKEI